MAVEQFNLDGYIISMPSAESFYPPISNEVRVLVGLSEEAVGRRAEARIPLNRVYEDIKESAQAGYRAYESALPGPKPMDQQYKFVVLNGEQLVFPSSVRTRQDVLATVERFVDSSRGFLAYSKQSIFLGDEGDYARLSEVGKFGLGQWSRSVFSAYLQGFGWAALKQFLVSLDYIKQAEEETSDLNRSFMRFFMGINLDRPGNHLYSAIASFHIGTEGGISADPQVMGAIREGLAGQEHFQLSAATYIERLRLFNPHNFLFPLSERIHKDLGSTLQKLQ